MSESIIVAIISAGVSLLGIFASQNDIFKKLDKNQAVTEEKINELNRRVTEHNGYARMFAENVPVIKERIQNLDHKIEDIERRCENHDAS